MRIIKDQTIENDALDLDDTFLLNCVVKKTVVFYSGEDFGWTNSRFEQCQLTLLGPAKNTENLLGHFGRLKEAKKQGKVSQSSKTVH